MRSTDYIRLMNFLSPNFPTGAFAYSHGLEAAFHEKAIDGKQGFSEWLEDLISYGSGWNDAVFVANSWDAATHLEDIKPIMDLCGALAPSKERYLEQAQLGENFMCAARLWLGGKAASIGSGMPLPVAVGVATGKIGMSKNVVPAAYVNSFVSNLIQAALRLGVFGQQDGIELLLALEPTIIQVSEKACTSSLDDVGSAATLCDIFSMRHETQASRIFIT